MNEILEKVTHRFGSEARALDWYQSQSLAGFDGKTAAQLVEEGMAQAVLNYIEAVDAGVFA